MANPKSYIDEQGEALELDDKFFAKAKRGRPVLSEDEKKKRVNLMLDPDVVDALKARGNMSKEANKVLREELGLD